MARSTQKQNKPELVTVSTYIELFGISRHAVHRRIKKFENTGLPINNVVDVERHGPKIILIKIDKNIPFEKKY